MAENTFTLEIVTPTKLFEVGEVQSLVARGIDGYFGVLKNHCPAMFALDLGYIKYSQEGEQRYLATNGGYAEIRGNKVLLLVETAEYAHEIDVDRAKASLERARERLEKRGADIDLDRARSSMYRAMNRMKVAEYK